MQQLRPQVGERRFRSLVAIQTGRLQAVTAGAVLDVDDFNERVVRGYEEGTAEKELPAEEWAAGLNRIDFGETPLTLGGGEVSTVIPR